MRHLDGFAPLAAEYDGFVLDLWGVIHDGIDAYPAAADVLARLRASNRRVVLLSNAPRRAAAVEGSMRRMGLVGLWDGIVTSGEVTHAALRDRPDAWWEGLGERVFHLGPERDRNVMDGLDLVRVDRPGEASLVLNTGPDDFAGPGDAEVWRPLLAECLAAGLPMICANPDLTIVRGGRAIVCAGMLSAMYRAMGGDARDVGKPDPAVYVPALAMLGGGRTLAVGDSLRTDIAGAGAAGLDACWVFGGIHADEVRAAGGPGAFGLAGHVVATVPTFRW